MKYAREITAAVLAPIAIWIIGWGHDYVFDAAVAICAAIALHEFLMLGRKKGYFIPVALCIVVMCFIVAAFVLEPVSVEMGVFVALLVIPGAYVMSGSSLDDALPASGISTLATLYVGMLGGSLIRLRGDFHELGPKLVFFLLAVVWIGGDSGAYYVGRTFGKHKMSPLISPKKTIEGAVGGVIFSIIAAVIVHLTFFHEFPLVHAIIAGAVLSLTGMIGDLAESMWKRSAHVKDSGTLLPGHGGFLDRFDSVLFTAPILYTYWSLIVRNFKTLNIMQG